MSVQAWIFKDRVGVWRRSDYSDKYHGENITKEDILKLTAGSGRTYQLAKESSSSVLNSFCAEVIDGFIKIESIWQ